MTALPFWAQNATARSLIARIIAEQPDFTTSRDDWQRAQWPRRYQGDAARDLRRLFNRMTEDAFATADARFAQGEPWEVAGADANALLSQERPDELVERLLAEHQLTEVHGDPFEGRFAA